MTAWIVGAGAQGRVVLDALRAGGRHASICFVDDNAALQGTRVNGAEIIGGLEAALASGCKEVEMIVAIGHPLERMRLGSLIAERGMRLTNAIHPSAVIAKGATIGCGNFIGPQAVVYEGARVGNHAVLNVGVIADHDTVVEDGAALAAGAILSSRAHLEPSSFLCSGAIVTSRVRIGRGTVVAAGAVAMKDLPEYVLAWGNPARVMERIPDFDWKRVL